MTLILFNERAEFGPADSFTTRAPSFINFVAMFANFFIIVRGSLLLVPGDEVASSSESPGGVLQLALLHAVPALIDGGGVDGGGRGGSGSAGSGSSTGTKAGRGTSSAGGGYGGEPSLFGSLEMHSVLSSLCISSLQSVEQIEFSADEARYSPGGYLASSVIQSFS